MPNFAALNNKNNIIMGHQVLIWTAVMILLFVIFVLKEAISMQRHAGHTRIIEFADEFDIYDWDED